MNTSRHIPTAQTPHMGTGDTSPKHLRVLHPLLRAKGRRRRLQPPPAGIHGTHTGTDGSTENICWKYCCIWGVVCALKNSARNN